MLVLAKAAITAHRGEHEAAIATVQEAIAVGGADAAILDWFEDTGNSR